MRLLAASCLALALCAPAALAQGKPPAGGMPPGIDPAAIKEKVKQAIQQLVASAQEETVEVSGICKITYKKIPTDPKRVAEILGQQMGGGAPAGVDMDGMIKQYEPQIAEMLNENLTDIGKLEALVPLKLKSKTIPVGEWRIGLEFEGERPASLTVRGDELPQKGKPIPIRLKTRPVDLQKELTIELKEPKKQKEGAETFEIQISFMRNQAKSASKLERGKEDPKAGDEKEEDKDEKEEGKEEGKDEKGSE